MKKVWAVGLIILLKSLAVWSDVLNIMVVGLFSGQAVLTINNKQRLLKVGATSPEGVTLISATSQQAVLEVDGIQKKYLLSSQISGTFAPAPASAVVTLWPTNGMYLTPGTVNGFSVDFVVDTGASSIALNIPTAKRLGLNYLKGKKVRVETASGLSAAYAVTLGQVQVGDIKLYNVGAVVIDGNYPQPALLGMTFLGKLDIQSTDHRMQLKKKFR